jgi:hypothetical protein
LLIALSIDLALIYNNIVKVDELELEFRSITSLSIVLDKFRDLSICLLNEAVNFSFNLLLHIIRDLVPEVISCSSQSWSIRVD